MTRMKKEFYKRGIIFDAPDYLKRIEDDCDRNLFMITDKVIITIYYSSVVDPMFHFFDRFTLEEIGRQNVYKDDMFFNYAKRNPWSAFVY